MIKRNNINRRMTERRKQDISVESDRRMLSNRRLGEDRRKHFA